MPALPVRAQRMLAPAISDFEIPVAEANTDLRFLPMTLTMKFKGLVETYHRTRGYAGLPELLWTEEARSFIELHDELLDALNRASRTRSAKKANACYVMIAAIMLSVEALASDFAGWGMQFPTARRKALAIYNRFPPNSRTHLLDFYLSPRSYMPREILARISPS
jgi:hypothetical protein